MNQSQLLGRLRLLADRRRWIVGLSVSRRLRRLRLALVAVQDGGYASRCEVLADVSYELPQAISREFARLSRFKCRAANTAALAASLAETQAAALDDFAAVVSPVWDRVLAVAVREPSLRQTVAGVHSRLALCDGARLAEYSGLNVIDAFAERDVALEGRGGPLSPVADWILLHDAARRRVLVELGQKCRLTCLPPSRDTSGAKAVLFATLDGVSTETSTEQLGRAIVAASLMHFGPSTVGEEYIVCQSGPDTRPLECLAQTASRWFDIEELGVSADALSPARAAVLGLLHLDQTPANLPAITGARHPRILGRLTPGSLSNWHRLLRAMAAASPPVVTLRSAV